jgi:hypothetical protein
MLEASKGKGAGSMLQRRGSINIGGKRYWKRIEGVFWMRGSQQARCFWGRQEGKLRRNLFHREERPARDIIDTSEWTRADYRYFPGQHFDL